MIVFREVRYKNFMSAGNVPITIRLDKSPTTLITGPNGSGKSMGIIDAVFFALYGKAYRKVKKSQMVNSINKKNCLVELDFSANGHEYTIRRGVAPNVFDIIIDGKKRENSASVYDDQDYLENVILKMNATTMKQIVFLGSTSYIPFMRLPAAARRAVVEEVLDIQVFSLMTTVVKKQLDRLTTEYNEICSHIKMLNNTLDLQQQHIDRLNRQRDDVVESNNAKIAECRQTIEKNQKEIVGIQQEVESKLDVERQLNDIQKSLKEIQTLERMLEKNLSAVRKKREFFAENEHCMTCGQDIDHDVRQTQISQSENAEKELFQGLSIARKKSEQLSAQYDGVLRRQKMIHDLERQIVEKMTVIRSLEQQIEELEERNSLIADDTKNQSFKELKSSFEQTQTELANAETQRAELADEMHYYTVIQSLLRDDGIKSMIVRNYLPTINSLIQKYLEILEFNCKFTFNENFEENIKARHRDIFSYANFSEGQKLRIDLALLFTWRELARLRNSSSTNLLVLDEIGSSSLDVEGTEAFMSIINKTASNSNVFIISHDSSIQDRFKRVLTYRLENNFSVMEEICD